MSRRRWWRNTLIWLNAASGAVAFLAIGWGAMGDALPWPKWAAILLGSIVAGINVALHFIITDASVLRDIKEHDKHGSA
jgi:hypothetical protein